MADVAFPSNGWIQMIRFTDSISRSWPRYRPLYRRIGAGGIDNCTGVINRLVVYFRIVDRTGESENERDRVTNYLLFANFSFFYTDTKYPAVRINWFVEFPFFFPLTERWTGEEGRIISASFECRVIKNNWHGKCNDIASGSRIY